MPRAKKQGHHVTSPSTGSEFQGGTAVTQTSPAAVTRSKAKAKGVLKRPAAAAISSMSEVEDFGSPIVEPLEES